MGTKLSVLMIVALLAGTTSAHAQEIVAASNTTRFVLDAAFLLAGALAALMVVFAFGLRDVGLARPQHTFSVCLRMMGMVCVSAIAFWLSGYDLMYQIEPGGLLGDFGIWRPNDDDPLGLGYPSGIHWAFHMALATIGVAIVSSAISERVKLWSFLIFTAAFAGLIYPIVAGWVWGGGYLDGGWDFYDFAGAGVIHITGGAAALMAASVVGPRSGRHLQAGGRHIPSEALPLTAFGSGLIWLSLLLVMVAKVDTVSTIEGAISIGKILATALLAAASAVIAALFLTQVVYKRVGLVTASCAAVGGLVAISADPINPSLWQATMIGAVSGVIVTVAPPFLSRFKIDDAGLVVPTHLLCGTWGIIVVAWANPSASFVGQIVGAGTIGAFAATLSMLFWIALKYTLGARLRSETLAENDTGHAGAH